MPIITGGKIMEGDGVGAPLLSAGAPTALTTEVQTITAGDATGGTFALTFEGCTTTNIAFDATAATIQAALRLLGSIGGAHVLCAGGAMGTNPVTVTFHASAGVGNLCGLDVPLITVDPAKLTGGTDPGVGNGPTVEATTAGVSPTARGAAKGSLLIDTTNGILYINTGTAPGSVWTKVGTQS